MRLLTLEDVAARLGISPSTLRWWRHRGEGPPSIRLGRHVRYPEDALEAWLAAQIAEESARLQGRAP